MVDRGAMTPNISIHAPTGGATDCMRRNPVRSEISIHAPTGGATIFCALPRVEKTYFNPRSHGGSDNVLFDHNIFLQ